MVSLIVLTMVQCTFTILKKWALHPVVKLGFKPKQKKSRIILSGLNQDIFI